MSPAYSEAPEDIFSWVGIIMYLPTQDEQQREKITAAFEGYKRLRDSVSSGFGAMEHWAKLETPKCEHDRLQVHHTLSRAYPIAKFNAERQRLDPRKVLSNNWVESLFTPPSTSPAA